VLSQTSKLSQEIPRVAGIHETTAKSQSALAVFVVILQNSFKERLEFALHELLGEVRMAIRLDHTIVPAKDKVAAAKFFAEIFGLSVEDHGHFAEVQINESLTFAFADEPKSVRSHHYAFHISDAEFDAIFERVKAREIPYGSGPFSHSDGKINTRRGGRGFYFEDPNGHLLEVMTVPETGS
jgi:catechol 2,3-dioxygenase-like lactoylglutathione lyase family enzyme